MRSCATSSSKVLERDNRAQHKGVALYVSTLKIALPFMTTCIVVEQPICRLQYGEPTSLNLSPELVQLSWLSRFELFSGLKRIE